MSKQIHNLGKDDALDSSITKLQQKLSDAGFHIVEQSCTNPIANICSVSIHDRDCPLLSKTGSGLSEKSALFDALNTFSEFISSRFFWSSFYLGKGIGNSEFVYSSAEKWFLPTSNGSWPKHVLTEELCDFYNPVGELDASSLIDIGSGNQKRGICCTPFKSLRSQETVYFPVNLVDNLYLQNGIASGDSIVESRIRALSLIIKNYIQAKVIAEGIALPNIPDTILKTYPSIHSSLKSFDKAGYSLLIKDASLNGTYPVILTLLLGPSEQTVSSSFGANPNFEKALEESITALFKNTSSNNKDPSVEAGFDMDEISSPKNLINQFNGTQGITSWESLSDTSEYSFFDWRKKYSLTDLDETFNQLSKAILNEANDIYIADFDDLESPSCRILVPGLSEILPVDDLVWENNNTGIKVRERILNNNKSIQECEQLIEDLEDLDLDDKHLVSKLIGMPADTDCIFYDLSVAELILLLALKTQDNERMQEGCEWILHYQQLDKERLKTYKCINTILQLDGMTDYATVLEKLYTQDILNNALALIAGEDVFPLDSEWKTHGLLIEAYKKTIKTSK